MKDSIISIVLAIIASSAAILTFTQFLITRHDNKKGALVELTRTVDKIRDDVADLKESASKQEGDNCRQQLMLLIHISPNNAGDIIPLAFHYFVELKGDTYMTNLFQNWLVEKSIDTPIWFKGEHK